MNVKMIVKICKNDFYFEKRIYICDVFKKISTIKIIK